MVFLRCSVDTKGYKIRGTGAHLLLYSALSSFNKSGLSGEGCCHSEV